MESEAVNIYFFIKGVISFTMDFPFFMIVRIVISKIWLRLWAKDFFGSNCEHLVVLKGVISSTLVHILIVRIMIVFRFFPIRWFRWLRLRGFWFPAEENWFELWQKNEKKLFGEKMKHIVRKSITSCFFNWAFCASGRRW